MLNKTLLIGRLGADPEIRYTPSGTAVANFSIATDTPVKRGDDWESETEWHKVVTWDKLAEFCKEYLKKGRLIYVEGRLRTRNWEDQDGIRRSTTEIIAREIQILDPKNGRKKEEE